LFQFRPFDPRKVTMIANNSVEGELKNLGFNECLLNGIILLIPLSQILPH